MAMEFFMKKPSVADFKQICMQIVKNGGNLGALKKIAEAWAGLDLDKTNSRDIKVNTSMHKDVQVICIMIFKEVKSVQTNCKMTLNNAKLSCNSSDIDDLLKEWSAFVLGHKKADEHAKKGIRADGANLCHPFKLSTMRFIGSFMLMANFRE